MRRAVISPSQYFLSPAALTLSPAPLLLPALRAPTEDLLTKPYNYSNKAEIKTSAGGINYTAETVVSKDSACRPIALPQAPAPAQLRARGSKARPSLTRPPPPHAHPLPLQPA